MDQFHVINAAPQALAFYRALEYHPILEFSKGDVVMMKHLDSVRASVSTASKIELVENELITKSLFGS